MNCCLFLVVALALLIVGGGFVLWAVIDVARQHDDARERALEAIAKDRGSRGQP